jgi:protein TonB
MYAHGFFEQQRRRSPTSFALVVALHAAGFGALILAGGTQIIEQTRRTTQMRFIPIPPDPPPVPPPPRPDVERPAQQPTFIDPTRALNPNNDNQVTAGPTDPPLPDALPAQRPVEPASNPPPPPPVRREAQVDRRYAADLQPPYPPSEERAQRGGFVRVRVTVAPNGRVMAVERLSATSDAFWRATERQALGRWRFRPATLDGRPVQGTTIMTVRFRIEDA